MSLRKQYYRIYSKYNAAAIANSLIGRSLLRMWSLSGRVLYKMGYLEQKPWFSRSTMFSVRGIREEAERRREGPFPLPSDVKELKDLRMACVVDGFTELAFRPECQLLSIGADDWQRQLETFRPHLLLVESVWFGKEESWKWKVSVLSPEIIELVAWCKGKGIPTVFWNKEDPKHLETFIRTAGLFDVIFTTDADCIADYRIRCETDRAYLLPFAAQPKIHNPIETYDRKDSFCFAGSYYAQQMDRNLTFSRFVNTISFLGELEIFDRYLNSEDSRLSFPERYKRFIVGTLPPEDIDRAYKGYRYGINMNTIKRSQTMFARRVFELLASNTITVSNYSRGQRNLLGDLTVCTDDTDRLRRSILRLQKDIDYADKYRLAGLREVMLHHTYHQRLAYIVEKVYGESLPNGTPKVVVIAHPHDRAQLRWVVANFDKQSYPNKRLIVLWSQLSSPEEVAVLRLGEHSQDRLADLTDDATHISWFDPRDHYGENYLLDLVLGHQYSQAEAVGKTAFLCGDGSRCGEGQEYRFVAQLPWRSSLVKIEALGEMTVKELLDTAPEGQVHPPVCLALDRFNYCRNAQVEGVPDVADLVLGDTGMPMRRILEEMERRDGEASLLGHSDILMLYSLFPSTYKLNNYGFLHSLPSYCHEVGLKVEVVRFSDDVQPSYYDVKGLDVAHLTPDMICGTMDSAQYRTVQVHLLSEKLWEMVREKGKEKRISVHVYGPEVFPFVTASTNKERMSLEKERGRRKELWKEVLSNADQISINFATRTLMEAVLAETGVPLDQEMCTVLPSPLDVRCHYLPKSPGHRFHLLVVKPYADAYLDGGLMMQTLQELSRSEVATHLHVTLIGDWTGQERGMGELKGRVKLELIKGGAWSDQTFAAYRNNGILLAPYVKDWQGAALAEAMAMGMVPVTTDVGAVRELIDEKVGRLCKQSPQELAASVEEIIRDQATFLRLSASASQRAGEQRGQDLLDRSMVALRKESTAV